MGSLLSLAERDRRWTALSAAMEREGLDALVFVASHFDGQRGSVRYVADYRLFAFYCYAVMGRDREPTMILPGGMRGARRGGWVEDYRFVADMVDEVGASLRDLKARRVGVVGLSQVMRIADHRALVDQLDGVELIDASELFDEVRAAKSEEEVRGTEEAAYIADRCLERVLEVARPGVTKMRLGGEALKVCAELGGADPIWLTLDNLARTGEERTRWAQPSDDVLAPGDTLMFSLELIGPSGYWVELCRMVTFAPPTDEVRAIHAAVAATMMTARTALRPGVDIVAAQREILATATGAETHPAYWLGHSIGQDVIETPMIGLEPAPAPAPAETRPLTDPMLFAFHPLLVPNGPGHGAYMADTYVLERDGCRPLSQFPLDLITLPG